MSQPAICPAQWLASSALVALATPPSSQDREARADDRASHQCENGLSLEGYYYECEDIGEFYNLVATRLVSPSDPSRCPSGAVVKRWVATVCEERKRILLAGRIPPYREGRENLDQAIDCWVEIEGRRSMRQAVSDLVSSHLFAFGSEESTLEFVFLPAYQTRLRKNAEHIRKRTSENGKANSVICMRLVRFVEGLFEGRQEDLALLPTHPPRKTSSTSISPLPTASASAPIVEERDTTCITSKFPSTANLPEELPYLPRPRLAVHATTSKPVVGVSETETRTLLLNTGVNTDTEACQDRISGNLGRSSLGGPSQATPRPSRSSISTPSKEPNGESKALFTRPSVVYKEKAAAVRVRVGTEGRRAQGASSSTDPGPSQISSGKKYAAIDPPFFDGPAVKRKLLFPRGGRTERQENPTRKPSKTGKTSTRLYSRSDGKVKRKTAADAVIQPSSSPGTVGTSSTSQIETIPCRPHHMASSNGVAEPRNAGYRADPRSAAAAQAQILRESRDQPESYKGKSPAPHAHRKRKLGVLNGAGSIDLTASPDRKRTKREELVPKRPPGGTASSNQDIISSGRQLEESSQLQSMERRLATLEKLLGSQQGVMGAYEKQGKGR
ncbi:hypothetical protein DL764_007197 [Monosporascus ibericus]|uniref:Uncharacterized protein n=1 Tax=Monosporascus ibericus TaxID=155417 RepID=A0A4Q4T695_9PEZI|nr:hypothetical protein DL764_007197 [Monosporascus ibericus]